VIPLPDLGHVFASTVLNVLFTRYFLVSRSEICALADGGGSWLCGVYPDSEDLIGDLGRLVTPFRCDGNAVPFCG